MILYLPKEQVEKYVEINKRLNSEDLVCGKYNFNTYLVGQDEEIDDVIENATLV